MILFFEPSFLLFFLIVFSIYWLLPHKRRNILLLISSYVFYASWDWRMLSLLILSTYANLFCGHLVFNSKSTSAKKLFVLLSLLINLSLLGFFKYYNFFAENLTVLLSYLGVPFSLSALNIILPIGISFYTFQSLTYVIDIYRGKINPEKSVVDFFLFVSYFPQLIAGPIERSSFLLPQLKEKKYFRDIEFSRGAYLFLYGFVKKVFIADVLAGFVDSTFSLSLPDGIAVFYAVVAFTLQLYCDFSGYVDMARGISCFFGITLSRNFITPFLSANPSDFWDRWHITLSTWVRDYVYIPLGGSRTALMGVFPLFVTMGLIGLWHGASWNFVLLGLYWASAIYLYRIILFVSSKLGIRKIRDGTASNVLLMFQIVIMSFIIFYSSLIFRSQSIDQIITYNFALFNNLQYVYLMSPAFAQIQFLLLFILAYDSYQYLKRDEFAILGDKYYIKLFFLLTCILLYFNSDPISSTGFIYFQF